MQRKLFFVYGVLNHLLFLGVFAAMAVFVGDLLDFKTIDRGGSADSLLVALAVDLALLLGFALPHSIMARPGFKRIWTRIVPQPVERSTYVLVANLTMIGLMAAWQPIPMVIWDIHHPAVRAAIWTLLAAGWLMVPLVSLLINHFDLFGTRQVWLHLRKQSYTPLPFRTPSVYRRMRHPLYVGWMIAFWSAPTMTAGHLLFALVLSAYMILAIRYEERDLVGHFGSQYTEYRRNVPAFIPKWPALPQTLPARPQSATQPE